MPLMSPEIQRVLRKLGKPQDSPEEEITLTNRLELAGLGLDKLLDNLAYLAENAGNDALKLKANETGLKLHNVLKESATVSIPSFTIVINDPEKSNNGELNPILLPRQLLSAKETIQ